MEVQTAPRKTIADVIQARIELAEQRKSAASLLANTNYQSESKRPLVCLLFIIPLIMVYETGTLLLGGQGHRSGVDQWLDHWLSSLGMGQLILLPVVVTATMIAWHHRLDDHWRIRWTDIGLMTVESIGLGLTLYWTANACHLFSLSPFATANLGSSPVEDAGTWWSMTIAVIGSGIYEELFFRLLLLLSAIYWVARLVDQRRANLIGIGVVSLLFAGLHYDIINPAGSQLDLTSFLFRFVASIVFCVLFLFRGFGIAVGTHVTFDVLTQM